MIIRFRRAVDDLAVKLPGRFQLAQFFSDTRLPIQRRHGEWTILGLALQAFESRRRGCEIAVLIIEPCEPPGGIIAHLAFRKLPDDTIVELNRFFFSAEEFMNIGRGKLGTVDVVAARVCF